MPPYIQIYFCKHATIQETQTIALSMVYTPIHQTGHIHTNHHIPLSISIYGINTDSFIHIHLQYKH